MASPSKKKKKRRSSVASRSDEESSEDEAVKMARREALALVLRQDITTPYLTCQRCNSVTFINVNRIRGRDSDPTRPLSVYEQLPVCSGCGTTKYLRAGVVRFQEKIADEQQKIKEFEQKRGPATALIVRIARGFLGRLAFRRKKRERELYILKINRAATLIQTRVRGVQARTRTIYERCLRLIKTMHPSILQYALRTQPELPPVFWYENPGERQILYWDYREFVRRSGGKPPQFKVENNIMEITRRMLQREYELVSRIQSRWRGLTTRLVFCEFKRQRGWLKGLIQSPVIKIQRLYRAHVAERRCAALRVVRNYPSRMDKYREERQVQAKREEAKAFRKKLLNKYRLAYQSKKTSKMLALHTVPETQEEEDDLDLDDDVKHSLKDHDRGEKKEKLTRRREHQHPNTRKLAEMKRLMDGKQRKLKLRGPRLHILAAKEMTAREEQDDR